MIDLHSHILWGLDDGSRTFADSLAMLKLAGDSGTTDIVATPHADLRYPFRDNLVTEKIHALAFATGGAPRIHRGCDFHLSFDNVQQALRTPGRFTINRGPYLMVEFPPVGLTGMEQVLSALLDRGLIPVITHPERHMDLMRIPPLFEAWIRMGCLAQVTAQSLLGRFGKKSERAAWTMIHRGLAHFVASDAHDVTDRPPRLDIAFQAVSSRFGETQARLLFTENPQAALRGSEVRSELVEPGSWFRRTAHA